MLGNSSHRWVRWAVMIALLGFSSSFSVASHEHAMPLKHRALVEHYESTHHGSTPYPVQGPHSEGPGNP